MDPHDSRTWGDWAGGVDEPFPFQGFVSHGRFIPPHEAADPATRDGRRSPPPRAPRAPRVGPRSERVAWRVFRIAMAATALVLVAVWSARALG